MSRRALASACVGLLLAAPSVAAAAAPDDAPRPPRVDGSYVGVLGLGSVGWARVNGLDTPNPFVGFGGAARLGQELFPWMTLGLQVLGNLAYTEHEGARQRLAQGALLVELGFLPVPRIPLSIRGGFGIGGGAVRQTGESGRSGFGGSVFTAAVRYEWFPLADRFRPRRGGGWTLGPEVGWLGATPAAPGRPMSNSVYLGLWTGFYFGD